MNIFDDNLIYQYMITGTFILVINTFLFCSCINNMEANLKDELFEEDNNNLEKTEEQEVEDYNNNSEEDTKGEEEEEEGEGEEEEEEEEEEGEGEEGEGEEGEGEGEGEEGEGEEEEEEEEEAEYKKYSNWFSQESLVYNGFNLMTKKQLIRFVGKEHTYKNKNELIIIAINKFILISIDRVDSIPVFVRNYIKNN